MISKFSITALAALLLCSCTPKPVTQTARNVARNFTDVATEIPIPKPQPRPPLPTEAEVERAAITILEPHAGQAESESEVRLWMKAACMAKDMMELGQARTWSEAARKSVETFGGKSIALPLKVESLGKELKKAEDGMDFTMKVTAATICELA